MCGIYATNIPYKESEVKEKLNTIKFRGPDFLGVDRQGEVMFGHLRLAIIDLDERSNQPFIYEKYRIVFNGEIYNYKDIRQELTEAGHFFSTDGDTEVILKGYIEWGEKIVDKLNGMFAFVIHDQLNNSLFCARDRMGVKPFYYYWNGFEFEICSQLRPIMRSDSSISASAISIYLECGYIPSPYTVFDNFFKLPPGNTLTLNLTTKKLTVGKYWDLKKVKTRNISFDDAKKEVHELLKDAVRIRMNSDVPFGSFLSGGIDSALVSAIASEYSKSKLKTFTIGFEDPRFDESKVAKQFSQIIGTDHHEAVCKSEDVIKMLDYFTKVYDEPFADSSALPSMLLNSLTKPYVTVALSGDGGDESFLGYTHFDLLGQFLTVNRIPYILRKAIAKLNISRFTKRNPETVKRILLTRNHKQFSKKIFTGFGNILKNQDESWLSNYSESLSLSENPYQSMADLNIKLWLENDSNVKVDRASMAYSVEVRSPFLDYRIIEHARTLPVEYRYANGQKKKILKSILAEYIPEEVFNLPKKGFAVPLADWIKNDLRQDIENMLSVEFLQKVPNLNIDRFKNQLSDHLNGVRDYSFNIWKMYVLAKWYQEWEFTSVKSYA